MSIFKFLKQDDYKNYKIIEIGDEQIVSPIDGQLIDVSTVSDEVFAREMMGESIAIKSDKDIIVLCSPANGTLTVLFQPTYHAFGITMNNGVELLVHCGINTVYSKGKGFRDCGKKVNDIVKAGEPIIEMNLKELRKQFDTTIFLIITSKNDQNISLTKELDYIIRGTVISK